jgi:hypothetical protein
VIAVQGFESAPPLAGQCVRVGEIFALPRKKSLHQVLEPGRALVKKVAP